MIEYLERLVAEEKYEDAASLAEELLRKQDNSLLDVLVISSSLVLIRFHLNQMEAAVRAGEAAVQLAYDLQEWDYYGTNCLNLGAAHLTLKHYSEVLAIYRKYLVRAQSYRAASRLEPLVWYNIGLTQGYLGRRDESLSAYSHALKAASTKTEERDAHGIRQAVMQQYLNSGELPPVPRLLAETGRFLRRLPGPRHLEQSWFFHLQLRAEFAVATNRLQRGTALALKGIGYSHISRRHLFSFHMLLANISGEMGIPVEACAHGVAAQEYAKRIHRFDLASQAADLVYNVSSGERR